MREYSSNIECCRGHAATWRNVFRPQRRRSRAYANAPVTDINTDKLREPTSIQLASHRTLSFSLSLSLSLALATSRDGDGAASWRCDPSVSPALTPYYWRRCDGHGCSGGGAAHSLYTPHDARRWWTSTFACHGGQQHGRGVHLMTARLLRLLLRLPRSSAAARATDHNTSKRALFKYRDAVCVILATYIGARYNTYIHFWKPIILTQEPQKHRNSSKSLIRKNSPLQSFLFEKVKQLITKIYKSIHEEFVC